MGEMPDGSEAKMGLQEWGKRFLMLESIKKAAP